MNEQGISINEACAKRAESGSGYYLTDEDFARQCNPDGTVKSQAETTTIRQTNSDNSVTVNTVYLQIGLVAIAVVVLVLAVLLARKFKRKASK